MTDKQRPFRNVIVCCIVLLAACAGSTTPRPTRGEAMVAAANPHAVEAGLEILRAGGNAVDAAIAVSAVLGLVEPQSSGLGGGGFLLHYNAADRSVSGYDGREQAPAGATPDMFLVNGQPLRQDLAQASGRSTGTPSLIAMLKMAHEARGRLPWARLFEPAIRLAENGFQISPRMARFITYAGTRSHLREDPTALSYFFDESGAPRPAGYLLRNPDYATTLRAIAQQGPRALSEGPIARAIVAAAQREPRAGTLTLADLQAYRPRHMIPVCGAFRVYRVCSSAAPASGEAVIAIVGLFARARPQPEGVASVDDWAAYLWANRLAYADRDHYVADDPSTPARQLVAPAYLDERARLIDLQHAPARVDPGIPAGRELFDRWGRETADTENGTSSLAIVDSEGNAVALTQTVESVMGSQRMVAGFLLNNQLTDFSFRPTLNGKPVANAAAPAKRPRSSMSPTIVTDANGRLVLVAGSPGSSSIISYVARTLIGVLDWGQTPQEAVATGNVVARAEIARLEGARLSPAIAEGLRARGWRLEENASEESGLHVIQVTPNGLVGGADPRREGVARSLSPAPAR